jgi:hypothetical protein
MSKLSSMLGRRAWALSVHRLLEAERHRFPAWWQYLHPSSTFPPHIRRQLVWACRPALLAIAGLLVDQRQPISAVALRRLRRFLTEPVDSPLVRDDPDSARRSAPGASVQLRQPARTVIGLAGLMPWTGCSAIAVVVFCWSGIHLDRSTATGNDSGDPVRFPPRSLSAEHDGSR